MKTLIRRRVLRRLIWVCIVCLCPKNGTLGLYGLNKTHRERVSKTQNSWQSVQTQNSIYRDTFSAYLRIPFRIPQQASRCQTVNFQFAPHKHWRFLYATLQYMKKVTSIWSVQTVQGRWKECHQSENNNSTSTHLLVKLLRSPDIPDTVWYGLYCEEKVIVYSYQWHKLCKSLYFLQVFIHFYLQWRPETSLAEDSSALWKCYSLAATKVLAKRIKALIRMKNPNLRG